MIYRGMMRVSAAYAVSNNGEEINRQLFLGYFTRNVLVMDLIKAIKRFGIESRVFTTSLSGQVTMFPVEIGAGLVFESAEEFASNYKSGLSYEDIKQGYILTETYQYDSNYKDSRNDH